MKTLRVIPFLLLLLFAGMAEAQKPIPGIQQTAQWKSMKTFVSQMQALSAIPVSSEQREAYSVTLQSKNAAVAKRIQSLYSQRINRIRNRDQRKEQREINRLQSALGKNLAELQSSRQAAINRAKDNFAAKSLKLRLSFGQRIDRANGQLAKLRKNLRRTKNPFRKQTILSHIAVTEENISTLRTSLRQKLHDARATKKQSVASIRNRYARKADSQRAYYKGLKNQVRSAWKRVYREDVEDARAIRSKQSTMRQNLLQRGAGYIAAMPPTPG